MAYKRSERNNEKGSHMSYPLSSIRGLTESEAHAFKGLKIHRRGTGMFRIRTTDVLLKETLTVGRRRRLARKSGVSEARLLELAQATDLLRVKGLGGEYVELLRQAGVKTTRELAFRNPEHLYEAMVEANEKASLGIELIPKPNTIALWVSRAKALAAEMQPVY